MPVPLGDIAQPAPGELLEAEVELLTHEMVPLLAFVGPCEPPDHLLEGKGQVVPHGRGGTDSNSHTPLVQRKRAEKASPFAKSFMAIHLATTHQYLPSWLS